MAQAQPPGAPTVAGWPPWTTGAAFVRGISLPERGLSPKCDLWRFACRAMAWLRTDTSSRSAIESCVRSAPQRLSLQPWDYLAKPRLTRAARASRRWRDESVWDTTRRGARRPRGCGSVHLPARDRTP